MIRKIWLYTVLSFSLTSVLAISTFAQTVTGSLVGRVEDTNGASVPGARVVAVEINRGTTRETTTNEEGNFTFNSVDPGIYRVEIEQANFKKFIQNNVEVAINSTIRVDSKLETGGVTEIVQVENETVQLKTDRADVSTQITNEQVEQLPLPTLDRNYQSILELSPGVTEAAAIGSNFGNPNGSVVSRVNGQNERYNNFQLDGTINNQLNVISQSAIVPPPEAIQVVDVSTNSYDAELGRAAGGVINVQIKSGTNNIRGSAWAYNTNSYFKAKNALSVLEKPVTNLNQFGFAVGGPIIKDKTFFFADYQGGRDRRGQNALLSVPTAAVRAGDFSGVIAAGTNCTPSGNTPSGCIFDPGNGLTAPSTRVQFAGNRIPQSRINPAAAAILARLPLPNRPGNINNYEVAGTFVQDRNSFDIKVDHKFSESTTAFGRYSFFQAATSDLPVFGDLGGATFGGGQTAGEGPSRNQSISANLTHVFSPKLITEFRFGFVRVHIASNTSSEDNLGNTLGIPNTNQGDFFSSAGIPRITITNYDFLGTISTIPFDITENSFNIVNNWTKIIGNHTIRFGGDLRSLRLDKYQVSGTGARGEFAFTGGLTTRAGAGGGFNALAAFLLGLPQTASRTRVAQLGGYRTPQYFFFIQDRWQVSPKLTVSYGLRYEIYPYPVGIEPGDQSRYDIDTNTALISGYGPVNDRVNVKTEFTNFAPRLGIAYRLDDKTVVRTGYGISYVPITMNTLANQNYGSQLNIALVGNTINLAPRDSAGNVVNLSTGIPNPQVLDLTSGVVVPPSTTTLGVVNPDASRGYVQSYNFTVERDLAGFVTSVGYVGSRGTRLPGTVNLNAGGPGATVADLPLNKRYGRTAQVLLSDFMLSNSYNSLQARVDRRFKNLGGRLTVAYTFAKSLDYTSAFSIDNDLIYDLNRGPSDFDRKHNLVISHVIRPFGDGGKLFDENGLRWKGLFGGFTLSGIFSARSGSPIDITGTNGANTVTQGSANRPNQIGEVTYLGGLGPGEKFFDTSVFVNPAPFTFGNVSRNSLRGPHYINYNATLARRFNLGERRRLEGSMAVLNVTNSPHFSNPSGSFTSGSFGISTATFGERQVRFGLKLVF